MKHLVVRPARWPLLLAAALTLVSCPYGSEFPIGDPAEGVADAALLGAWSGTTENGERFTITIRVSGEGGYLITAEGPEGEEPESMPALVSMVDGESFLNVLDEAWFFLNYRILDGTLYLRIVDDALFESRSFASPNELRAFLRENLADPRLYGEADGEEWDWVLESTGPAAAPASPLTSP